MKQNQVNEAARCQECGVEHGHRPYCSQLGAYKKKKNDAAREREAKAYKKYGGCTCMGHGECNFCKER